LFFLGFLSFSQWPCEPAGLPTIDHDLHPLSEFGANRGANREAVKSSVPVAFAAACAVGVSASSDNAGNSLSAA
jgi:hypothetical protein